MICLNVFLILFLMVGYVEWLTAFSFSTYHCMNRNVLPNLKHNKLLLKENKKDVDLFEEQNKRILGIVKDELLPPSFQDVQQMILILTNIANVQSDPLAAMGYVADNSEWLMKRDLPK